VTRDPHSRDHGVVHGENQGKPGITVGTGARSRGWVGAVRAFLRLVAIEHSVFALPFAYLSALTAMHLSTGRVNWADLALITVAMVGARTFAMAANRIIDRHIDARNPRTAHRELVTGVVSLRTAWAGAAVALAVFFGAALALNPLVAALAPLAVVPLVVYPYAKRFTDWPHAVLALAQAVAPVGAWLAVTGTFDGSGPAWVLGVAVGLWIGGFDLIYASQDAEIDREIGVRSVPARYGVRFALRAAVVGHVVTFGLFISYGHLVGFGVPWWIGLALAAVTFGYEHSIVKPHDLSRVNRAFFTANGVVGIVLFGFALVDLIAIGGLR
jgi:4-hydroxybenzoate polyprenyltransferase